MVLNETSIIENHLLNKSHKQLRLNAGCPRRSYKVLQCLIFVFAFIRLLERSYFCHILAERSYKGLILFFNETSIKKTQYRKQLSLNGSRPERGNVIVNTNYFFH